MNEPSGTQLAQLALRLGLGVNMLMHGLTRLPNLSAFVEKMAAGFANTILPDALTHAFLYVLPIIELIVGVLILVGGRLGKLGYTLGSFLLTALLFGTTLKQDWAAASTQVLYVLAFAFALRLHDLRR